MNSLPHIPELDISLDLAINGNHKDSEKILYSLNQSDPRVCFNLGWHKMRDGKLYEGFLGLENGRKINVFGGATPPNSPRYVDQDIKDKIILFINEGGLGDEIINIRFVKNYYDLGAKVVVASSTSLYPIFSKIPYIHCLVDRDNCRTVYHDYWVPAMSAAFPLKLEYKDINSSSYLDYFSSREFPNKNCDLKVGIKWSGNPKFEHQQHRKFPKEKMLKLTEIKKCKFYSLQRDEDLTENNNNFIDLKYEMKSWKDTAEIIASMDLIISSCTSIAHLSAAMGKPTWVIVPALPYYVWAIPGERSPWYDSVKLYRQKNSKNWDDVFERVYKDLSNIASGWKCSSGS